MAGLLGGGGGLRGHGELPLNADINVTSLVDVAFDVRVERELSVTAQPTTAAK